MISLATDFEDIDLDEYNNRGRKNHIPNTKNMTIQNDIFDAQPLV